MSQRAARDLALPIIPIPLLRDWVTRERDARLRENHPNDILTLDAGVVNSLGVDPGGLPIAITASGWVTSKQVEYLAKSTEEVVVVLMSLVTSPWMKGLEVELNEGVFVVDISSRFAILPGNPMFPSMNWPPLDDEREWGDKKFFSKSLLGAVIRSLAKGWGCAISEVLGNRPIDEQNEQKSIGKLAGKECFVDTTMIFRKPPPGT